jgi:predicted RNA-binding protein with TRAM domain
MQIQSYSKHLKADEDIKLGEQKIFTITDVTHEELGQGEEREKKYVLYFSETERGFPLNKTNLDSCLSKFGTDGDKWKGKKITLTAQKVQFGAKLVPGIRIVG